MPKWLEDKLKAEAVKQGLKPGSKEYDAYVYGTLNKYEKEQAQEARGT